MKKIDRDGLILCELQAKAFELSFSTQMCSSEIFIRRFMNSKMAVELDNLSILQTNVQAKDMIERVIEEYGATVYGSVKYSPDELYWIGYIYRYYSYTYGDSSLHAYKIVKPKELRGLYYSYHSLDPAQAIDRILEAKGLALSSEEEERRQFEIYKRIKNS